MQPADEKLDQLREILRSTEELLRAYDIKTEIAMICFVLSAEVVHSFVDFGRLKTTLPALAASLFIVFLSAMACYLSVLFPAYNLGRNKPVDYSPINVFFLTETGHVTTEDYIRTLDAIDLRTEMARQIMLLTEIRNTKHGRLLRALQVTFGFYALALFAGLISIVGR